MALSGEVIDFIRLYFLDDTDEVGGVGEVPVMHDETPVLHMRVFVKMIHALSIEEGSTTLDPVNRISLLDQEVREVSSILASNAGDQGDSCRCS